MKTLAERSAEPEVELAIRRMLEAERGGEGGGT